MTQATQQYIDLYIAQAGIIETHAPAALNQKRTEALGVLRKMGLPTSREERYKYTDAEKAFALDFGLNLQRMGVNFDPYKAFHCAVPHLAAWQVYVVNDTPIVNLHDNVLPKGVVIDSMANIAKQQPALLEHYYHVAAAKRPDSITALNTLFAQDGLVVCIPKHTKLPKAIQIVNIASATVDYLSNRRILVIAEDGAEAAIVICEHTQGDAKYLTTQVVEAYVGKASALHLYTIDEMGTPHSRFNQIYVEQDAHSMVSLGEMSLRSGQARNLVEATLLGKGARIETYGALIADNAERVDNHLLIDHVAEECESAMLYKYILGGRATGAFAGKVLVEKGAQKTNSQQTNANLLTAQTARAFSQPMLEIYADDVKCNHGSTIGKLDENALFYMRQRGIPEVEARLLLQHAFVNEVLRTIPVEGLKEQLAILVEKRFRGEATRCADCTIGHVAFGNDE